MRFRMCRYVFSATSLAILLSTGCDSGPDTGMQSSIVTGQVNLDGKPLPAGEILFALPGKIPQILVIDNGHFLGSVGAGDSRVEIRAYVPAEPVEMGGEIVNAGSQENYLPDKYNINSTLRAVVERSDANFFTFDIDSESRPSDRSRK